MLNPAALERWSHREVRDDFWFRLLNDKELQGYDDLEKLVLGCEIIAALDAVDLLAA